VRMKFAAFQSTAIETVCSQCQVRSLRAARCENSAATGLSIGDFIMVYDYRLLHACTTDASGTELGTADSLHYTIESSKFTVIGFRTF
jgi:hypothetical protein